MARGPGALKRQKEVARLARQREKEARRKQRREEKESSPNTAPDMVMVDPLTGQLVPLGTVEKKKEEDSDEAGEQAQTP